MDKDPLMSVGVFSAFEGSGFGVRILLRSVERCWCSSGGGGSLVLSRDDALPGRAVNTGRVVLEQGSRAWFSRVLTGLARQWWQ